jgi:hypothetical protein
LCLVVVVEVPLGDGDGRGDLQVVGAGEHAGREDVGGVHDPLLAAGDEAVECGRVEGVLRRKKEEYIMRTRHR